MGTLERADFALAIRNSVPDVLLSKDQLTALYSHFELLKRWNERMDLTSVETDEEIVSRHYCESLFFGAHLPGIESETKIVDFGSGAGFPGFPLAILFPQARVTLLESNQRRAVFL